LDLEIIKGTSNLRLKDVAHVLVPGRGRDASGFGLNPDGSDRIVAAQHVYELIAKPNEGRIVCSGYKSPADLKGIKWSPEESPDEVFLGMPEADIMRDKLVSLGVSRDDIRVERHSIDTVSNFLRSELEGYFGDHRPVAIVAQRSHLQRMLSVIAPRTLSRPYLGIVVREANETKESPLACLVSACILLRLPGATERSIAVAETRVRRTWRLARLIDPRQYH
jgi:uncharacterized SAM-binding protein YcdF (DUF218 family)